MLISGIKKTTLLDYPEKVATIVFTLGCNFRCHYCHNYEFVLPENVAQFMTDLIPEVAFFNFLESRKGFLDGVVISGGEPTIQKDIYRFAKKIKEMGYLVKLDTNGRDPEILEKLILDGIIDYVAMDIKYPFDKYKKIVGVDEDFEKIVRSKNIVLEYGNSEIPKIDYEFRTTIAKGYFDEEIIKEIGESILGAKKWYLQNFEEKNILNAGFDGKTFAPNELEFLKNIGEKYVGECFIRK